MEGAYREFLASPTAESLLSLRAQTSTYHVSEKAGNNSLWLTAKSPYFGSDDLRWSLRGMLDQDGFLTLNQNLFGYAMSVNVTDYGLEYQVPVGFISGAEDWTTPVEHGGILRLHLSPDQANEPHRGLRPLSAVRGHGGLLRDAAGDAAHAADIGLTVGTGGLITRSRRTWWRGADSHAAPKRARVLVFGRQFRQPPQSAPSRHTSKRNSHSSNDAFIVTRHIVAS